MEALFIRNAGTTHNAGGRVYKFVRWRFREIAGGDGKPPLFRATVSESP